MGNSNESRSFLQKGEGLRILSIKLNSPFDGKVQPFFDFIIDAIPLEPQRSAKQILDKLTSQPQKNYKSRPKDFNETIAENEDRKIQMKVVSTKYRSVRSIIVIPNRNWNGSMDLIGISVRKQKYDEVFDSYFPVSQVAVNSPIQMAGVRQGQYLLGCLQFPYTDINIFTEGLYDRYFDKQVPDKKVHLALYDMLQDQVSVKPIILKRGWGGQGLLGCQFLQGQVYKFPHNLKERREQLLKQQESKVHKQKIKVELKECNGASRTLAETLKNKRHKRGKFMPNIKNLISIPPFLPQQPTEIKEQMTENQKRDVNLSKTTQIQLQNSKISQLQQKINNLENALSNLKQYLDQIQTEDQSRNKA